MGRLQRRDARRRGEERRGERRRGEEKEGEGRIQLMNTSYTYIV